MPSRNINKIYVEGGFYHVYSRGVNKDLIYKDKDDYTKFLSILKRYLSPRVQAYNKEEQTLYLEDNPDHTWKYINLHCFCLMPNHFHLILEQKKRETMTDFMRRILNTYTKYFNKKYTRVGTLFQSRYKASRIDSDSYILHLSKYIHQNPQEIVSAKNTSLESYDWSSYKDYLDKRKLTWITTSFINEFFDKEKLTNSYRNFVEHWDSTQNSDKEYIPSSYLIDTED